MPRRVELDLEGDIRQPQTGGDHECRLSLGADLPPTSRRQLGSIGFAGSTRIGHAEFREWDKLLPGGVLLDEGETFIANLHMDVDHLRE